MAGNNNHNHINHNNRLIPGKSKYKPKCKSSLIKLV